MACTTKPLGNDLWPQGLLGVLPKVPVLWLPGCALKDKFAALSIRKGHKKSIVALAHKMLRIVFAVLKNKTPYLDKAVDYEALSVQRNAPRWMKMLIKHGYMPTAA